MPLTQETETPDLNGTKVSSSREATLEQVDLGVYIDLDVDVGLDVDVKLIRFFIWMLILA